MYSGLYENLDSNLGVTKLKGEYGKNNSKFGEKVSDYFIEFENLSIFCELKGTYTVRNVFELVDIIETGRKKGTTFVYLKDINNLLPKGYTHMVYFNSYKVRNIHGDKYYYGEKIYFVTEQEAIKIKEEADFWEAQFKGYDKEKARLKKEKRKKNQEQKREKEKEQRPAILESRNTLNEFGLEVLKGKDSLKKGLSENYPEFLKGIQSVWKDFVDMKFLKETETHIIFRTTIKKSGNLNVTNFNTMFDKKHNEFMTYKVQGKKGGDSFIRESLDTLAESLFYRNTKLFKTPSHVNKERFARRFGALKEIEKVFGGVPLR